MSGKLWTLYSAVLAATVSFLPSVVYVLVFQAEIGIWGSIVLWLLTTAVILEDWWISETIFARYTTESKLVAFASFLQLGSILSIPGVLYGAAVSFKGEQFVGALRYYGILLSVISVTDILFCVAYGLALRKSRPDDAYGFFVRYTAMDIALLLGIFAWIWYVLPSPESVGWKIMVLAAVYLVVAGLEAMLFFAYEHQARTSVRT